MAKKQRKELVFLETDRADTCHRGIARGWGSRSFTEAKVNMRPSCESNHTALSGTERNNHNA